MIHLRNSPFLWFAILLLTAYGPGPPGPVHPGIVFAAFIMALACGWIALVRYNPGHQLWSTVAISILVLLAGLTRKMTYIAEVFQGDTLEKSVQAKGSLRIVEVLKRKENATTLRCERISLTTSDSIAHEIAPDTYILVYLRAPPPLPLFPGDILTGHGWVSALQAPANPHAFDLRTHYLSMAIRHRMNCNGDEIQIQQPGKTSIWRWTAKWQYALSSIVRSHTSPAVGQLTNALVWGDRSDMDQEVIDAFADSGAMHVLSVSGMHVAIIYSMLYLLLGPPGAGTMIRRMMRLALYVTAIMLYMALTGASAAVVRAGWMIILFLLGKAMGWNTQVWNLLGFAAFIMLWINPLIPHNIGFQLSFLAMAGLLLYTEPVSRILSFKPVILHRTWEISAVSIAAQVFILPILLSKFHQFPLTFIASSLVAMPAGYVIIFGALLNVALSTVGVNGLWPLFDKAGEYFILCMKWMAGLNPEMHFAMPASASWMIMGVAVLFTVGLIYTWPAGKKLAYVMGVGAMCVLLAHRVQQWSADECILYHSYQGLLMDVMTGGRCYTIRDTAVTPASADFSARGHRAYRDIILKKEFPVDTAFSIPNVRYGSNLLRFYNMRIFILTDSPDVPEVMTGITHLVLYQCHDLKKTKDILRETHPSLTLLPAHLKNKERYALIRFLDLHQMPYYDISQKGYYQVRP